MTDDEKKRKRLQRNKELCDEIERLVQERVKKHEADEKAKVAQAMLDRAIARTRNR